MRFFSVHGLVKIVAQFVTLSIAVTHQSNFIYPLKTCDCLKLTVSELGFTEMSTSLIEQLSLTYRCFVIGHCIPP